MPIGAADTLLERRGIGGIGQHLTIVIAFEHQGVTASQRLYKMGSGLARIGQHTQLHASIGSQILNRFARIVRHGKRHQRQVADRQTVAVAAKMQGDAAAIGSQRLVSAIGEPYRDAVPAREFDYAADVILMFMRDHDAREICRRFAQPGQAALGFPQAEAAIQHDRGAGQAGGGGYQQRIALTATAETSKLQR